MAKEPPNLHRIEELAARKAQDTIYQRLRALAEPVDVAGREGVMWGDIECLFAELRGERQGNVVHASIRSTKTAPLSPTMPRGDDALNDYISVTNQEIHNIISAKHIDVEIKFKMIKGIINRCPFGSVGARGAEGTRGVGPEEKITERDP